MKTITLNIRDEYADALSITCIGVGDNVSSYYTNIYTNVYKIEDGMTLTMKPTGKVNEQGHETMQFVEE